MAMVEAPLRLVTLVAFEVGGAVYALDIARVREILRPLPIEVLPHAPTMLVGVFDHRGDVVPLIDLRIRFGVAETATTRETRWIIVDRGPRLCALIVDRVNEVFPASEASERDVPELGPGAELRGITAAYFHQKRLLFVVDPDRLTDVAGDIVALPPSSAPQVLR
jgi:purine-binding chemotaxis protein CheW